MSLMLGNLSVDDMQKRTGVEFPAELIEYMADKHQSKAENVQAGKWHCFDIPFVLVCGDMETAQHIFEHLSPLANGFKEQMKIFIT